MIFFNQGYSWVQTIFVSHFYFALFNKWRPIYRLEDEGSSIILVVSAFAFSFLMQLLFLEEFCN